MTLARRLPSPIDPRPALYAGAAVLLMLLVLFRWQPWDMQVASHYWALGNAAWPEQLFAWVLPAYRYGTFPALVTGTLGGLAFLLSYRVAALQRWRGPGLFLFLLLILGPGLLVNGLGKALAGRPRPSDVLGLGGPWNFHLAGHLGTPGRGGSFPSGHASMGFYWLAFFFLWRGAWRWAGLALGLAAGAIMSWARVIQGGHFLSDTLFAGALVFTVAAALSPLIHWQPRPAFWAQRKVLLAIVFGSLAYLSIGRVIYEERSYLWTQAQEARAQYPTQRVNHWPATHSVDKVALDLSLERGDLVVAFTAQPQGQALPLNFEEHLLGQGFPGAKDQIQVEALTNATAFNLDAKTLGVKITQALQGVWWTVNARYDLQLPLAQGVDARLKTARGVLTIGSLPPGRQVVLFGQFKAEDLPVGFVPHDQNAWLREGDQPQIALSLEAPTINFEP